MNEAVEVAVIGAGPAGLMAAERLSSRGRRVMIFDRMASPARKFLMAGRGGLNLTHSEPIDDFMRRYGQAGPWLEPLIQTFGPTEQIAWAEGLGQPTFIGSSGRVFPRAMKASPLLRAWLGRLSAQGAELRTRFAWRGWDENGALLFETPQGPQRIEAQAVVLALGGASWPRLGSDGRWRDVLVGRGVDVAPLQPANMGFDSNWSPGFAARFAGTPVKSAAFSFGGRTVRGEALVTCRGLEGGAIYALSGALRDAIADAGPATLLVDLRPNTPEPALAGRLMGGRRGLSTSERLRKAGLAPVEINLLREALGPALPADPDRLACAIKATPLVLTAPAGLERAISTAGGIRWDALDAGMMLKALPGVFACGEMLDWEAPTGGYLLQACFATGVKAAEGVSAWLAGRAC